MTSTPNGKRCRWEERRALNRYPIRAHVWFQWQGADQGKQETIAATRDISTHGVFILSNSLPSIGASVEVLVSMPPVSTEGNIRLQIRGRGKVVRTETDMGFAVQLLFHIEGTSSMPSQEQTNSARALYPDPPRSDERLPASDGRNWVDFAQTYVGDNWPE